MISILGVHIYEFSVAITDFILFIGSCLFAYFLYTQKTTQVLLHRLFILLFLSLSASSLLGAIFHAFFPEKTSTTSGFVIWILTALSIGITASVVWCINGIIFKGNKSLKIVLPFVILYLLAFIYALLNVDYHFKTIIFFYIPPMAIFALISLVQFLKNHILAWFYLFIGIMISFIAAIIQYLQISLNPIYFNFNSFYHLVQGIALVVIFLSFRSLLGEDF